MRRIEKPGAAEHVPYVLQYFDQLPDDGRVLEHLHGDLRAIEDLLLPLEEPRLLFRYVEGKWTIKEIVQHISDDERIYAYRALRFAREDPAELPGFEQDDYALSSKANRRSIRELLGELRAVRASTISLFEGLGPEAMTRTGIASGNVMSVRAIAYHIAGHQRWHMKVLRERYLS